MLNSANCTNNDDCIFFFSLRYSGATNWLYPGKVHNLPGILLPAKITVGGASIHHTGDCPKNVKCHLQLSQIKKKIYIYKCENYNKCWFSTFSTYQSNFYHFHDKLWGSHLEYITMFSVVHFCVIFNYKMEATTQIPF